MFLKFNGKQSKAKFGKFASDWRKKFQFCAKRYSPGATPVSFLKMKENCITLANPSVRATCVGIVPGVSSIRLAAFMRLTCRYSVRDCPVSKRSRSRK